MFNINYIELFILNTIVFFDLFDYPLTLEEICQWLYSSGMQGGDFNIREIEDCLKTSPTLTKLITAQSGFYFLKNRDELLKIRAERYLESARKYKLALRAIKIFKYLPFVKLIAVCNNLAYFNAKESSDIDLFVVSAKGRIWLVRLGLIIIISLLGLRPPKDKARDKICLSFYISAEHLNLFDLKIGVDDIYFNFWLATLMPVYQREKMYDQLWLANSWLAKYFPNLIMTQPGSRLQVTDNKFSQNIYEIKEYFSGGKFGDWLEAKAKKWQKKKMSQRKKDLAVRGDRSVIISDQVLKFHDPDRRQEYLDKFEAKLEELLGDRK